MRAFLAAALLALVASSVPTASAESVSHCVAMDACTEVAVEEGNVCAFVGEGRGSYTTACAGEGGVHVQRCRAGDGCIGR